MPDPGEPTTVSVPRANVRLDARLHRPKEAVRAGVLVLHPHPLMGGDMGSHVVVALAEAAEARGFAALRFDFRHARSRGAVEAATLHADAHADALAALENLRARLPAGAPVALAGYSFGGLVAARVAGALAPGSVAAVATVGLPVRMEDAPFADWPAFARAGAPLLAMQGANDEVGSPTEVKAFLARAGVAADVRPVPDASHGYFGEAGFVAKIAAGFLAKRLT